ncbi:uncharacterized protein LOC127252065 [Andrographis paniculata]|uniref:uncharacterized protein LOC127252065 n=1 Tax=Andrographis paniculata TaxID=175694 RepID=UPI0021E7001B|nr:uncharacterized protein LOC127252065 [Andrographis paniculata]
MSSLTSKLSSSSSSPPCYLLCFHRNNGRRTSVLPSAAKKDSSTEVPSKKSQALFQLKLPNSTCKLVAQSAAAVFALGFIDAGYSGDWSRIGVISRGTEGLLKVAAFLVVPLCLFLIISLSGKDEG